MPPGDLRKLWQLHQIDSALQGIRARAAALDPGRQILAAIQQLEARLAEAEAEASALSGELADRELSQKTATDKIAKIEKELYGGKFVNPREVEAFQKDMEMLKRQRAEHDERVLELYELVPPAKEKVQEARRQVAEQKQALAEHQKRVLAEKARLEAAYKEATAQRPAAAQAVPPVLLGRYEPLLKKIGTGMARITKENSCEACGLNLAEKVIEMAKEERPIQCEGCSRLLYYSEGVV